MSRYGEKWHGSITASSSPTVGIRSTNMTRPSSCRHNGPGRMLRCAWPTPGKLYRICRGDRHFRANLVGPGRNIGLEWTDWLSMIGGGELEAMQREANRVRVLPTAKEISQMEQAIGWPMEHLRDERACFDSQRLRANEIGRRRPRPGNPPAQLWRRGRAMAAAQLDLLRHDRRRIDRQADHGVLMHPTSKNASKPCKPRSTTISAPSQRRPRLGNFCKNYNAISKSCCGDRDKARRSITPKWP